MTPLQFRAAVNIDKEKMCVQALIEEVKNQSRFHVGNELKPEYQAIVYALEAQIKVLNDKILAL